MKAIEAEDRGDLMDAGAHNAMADTFANNANWKRRWSVGLIITSLGLFIAGVACAFYSMPDTFELEPTIDRA